jgi:hypothetical protein
VDDVTSLAQAEAAFNVKAVQTMFESSDFIGISNYPAVCALVLALARRRCCIACV